MKIETFLPSAENVHDSILEIILDNQLLKKVEEGIQTSRAFFLFKIQLSLWKMYWKIKLILILNLRLQTQRIFEKLENYLGKKVLELRNQIILYYSITLLLKEILHHEQWRLRLYKRHKVEDEMKSHFFYRWSLKMFILTSLASLYLIPTDFIFHVPLSKNRMQRHNWSLPDTGFQNKSKYYPTLLMRFVYGLQTAEFNRKWHMTGKTYSSRKLQLYRRTQSFKKLHLPKSKIQSKLLIYECCQKIPAYKRSTIH